MLPLNPQSPFKTPLPPHTQSCLPRFAQPGRSGVPHLRKRNRSLAALDSRLLPVTWLGWAVLPQSPVPSAVPCNLQLFTQNHVAPPRSRQQESFHPFSSRVVFPHRLPVVSCCLLSLVAAHLPFKSPPGTSSSDPISDSSHTWSTSLFSAFVGCRSKSGRRGPRRQGANHLQALTQALQPGGASSQLHLGSKSSSSP